MEWAKIAEAIFYFLASGAAIWIARSISNLEKSVSELNVTMAKIVERTNGHERRITRLEDKV